MNTAWRTFWIVWIGQAASLIGTAMTRFALLIWAYQQTSQATTVALLGFFAFAPFVVLGPWAGVIVDRFDRRRVMLVADLGAGLLTVSLLTLYATGELAIWHLYVAEALTGACEAFQVPAYRAATTLMVPPHQYGRAAGLRSLAVNASQVAAPFLAGALLVVVDIDGIMWLDVGTFVLSAVALLSVRFPRPRAATPAATPVPGAALLVGLREIAARPGLIGMMIVIAAMNLLAGLTYMSILPAMILARTGGSEWALAAVQGALGLGGVVGAALLAAWGGPRRQIHAVLAGAAISFFIGDLWLGIGRSVAVWATAAFLAQLFIPFIMGARDAIWQRKVPADIQGRVFATSRAIEVATLPLGFLLAGPLADRVFEPALAAGGPWADTFGRLVGTGPGAGMGLMFVGTCLLGTVVSLAGYLHPPVRAIETRLPDVAWDPVLEPGAAAPTPAAD